MPNADAAPAATSGRGPLAWLAAFWGVGGVLLMLGNAVYRLTPIALEPLWAGGLLWWHGALYVGSVAFNGYAEGYKAFQKAFSPRVAARALHLARHPRPLHVVLAPAFCMGLFHATRKRMLTSWIILIAVVGVVIAVRLLAQPWRGIIDAGVVVGLSWGIVATLVYFGRGLAGHALPGSADLPDGIAQRPIREGQAEEATAAAGPAGT
jgi:hypothetical protein